MSEQVRAPGYPEHVSFIDVDDMIRGYLEGQFYNAISDHGNDDEFTWRSLEDGETFTVRKARESVTPRNETEGHQMHQWELQFHHREKTLLLDTGRKQFERYEGEFTVPANSLDISDIIAASRNLSLFIQDRLEQGWNPYIEDWSRKLRPLD